jgi:hypothetical protein
VNPFPVVRATIARHRGTYLLFIRGTDGAVKRANSEWRMVNGE